MTKKVIKNDNEKLLISHNVKFAKTLSANDKKVRDRALKALKKWLQLRLSPIDFTEADFMTLWKGLFYSMWMSDKMLVQEECAENISSLVHLNNWKDSLLFFKCGLQTLIAQWFGIDQLRLDKFAMFVRRFLRQSLIVLANENWEEDVLNKYNDIISETILNTEKLAPIGLSMHFVEIFLEELAKVSKGEIQTNVTTTLLKPFMKYLSLCKETRLTSHVTKFIFHHLMRQSDVGVEYNERYQEWRQRGFPGGSIDVIQKVELSDDEIMSDGEEGDSLTENGALDPRAGHVDVELPQIPFDVKEIQETLKNYRFLKATITRNRKKINQLIEEFECLNKGEFPLGTKTVPKIEKLNSNSIKNSVKRMMNFERKLMKKDQKKRKLDDDSCLENENGSSAKKRKVSKENLESELQKFIDESENDVLDALEKKKSKKSPKASDINQMNKVLTKRKKLATNLYKKGKLKLKSSNSVRVKAKSVPMDVNASNCFQRNSGTWFVYENAPTECETISNNKEDEIKIEKNEKETSVSQKEPSIVKTSEKSKKKTKKIKQKVTKENKQRNSNVIETNEKNKQQNSNEIKTVEQNKQKHEHSSSSVEIESTLLTSTPLKRDVTNIFVKSEWDEPPKEGEIELFVPSKKYKQKMESFGKKKLSKSLGSVFSGSKSTKLNENLVRNPFSTLNLTSSAKKVKIALDLNQSQEVHEHIKMIKNSPAIPFDAEKKPMKPLLKKPVIASPINPFYKPPKFSL